MNPPRPTPATHDLHQLRFCRINPANSLREKMGGIPFLDQVADCRSTFSRRPQCSRVRLPLQLRCTELQLYCLGNCFVEVDERSLRPHLARAPASTNDQLQIFPVVRVIGSMSQNAARRGRTARVKSKVSSWREGLRWTRGCISSTAC